DVFAATVNLDEANTLRHAEPLDRPNHIYCGQQIRCTSPRFSPRGGERRRFCSAAIINRKNLVDLPAFLSLTHQDIQLRSWRNGVLPECLNRLDVQEGIAGTIGNFSEAKAFL